MDENNPVIKFLESEQPLIGINTKNPEEIIQQFRLHYRSSGQATYVWSYGTGLYRIDASHIIIPGTESFSDALEFILSSHHFGIYVLRDADFSEYGIPNIKRLKKLASHVSTKLTVLLGEHIRIPSELETHVGIFNVMEDIEADMDQTPIPYNPFMHSNHPEIL